MCLSESEKEIEVGYVSPDWRFTAEQKRLVVQYAAACFDVEPEDLIWKEEIDEDCKWEDGEDYIKLRLVIPESKVDPEVLSSEQCMSNILTYLDGFIWGVSYA